MILAPLNLMGDKYARLEVIGFADARGNEKHWTVRCDCGTVTEVSQKSLRSGNTQSCGCLKKERQATRQESSRIKKAVSRGVPSGSLTSLPTHRGCGVYVIRLKIDGRCYIGSSNDVYTRLHNHRGELRSGKHKNEYLQRTWDKYGEGEFEFLVIEYCDESVQIAREQFHIDSKRTWDRAIGFNLSRTADKPTMSDESRAKIAAKLKGRAVTDRQRAVASLTHKGKLISDDHKRRISISQTGRKHTQESIQKMKAAQKGKRARAVVGVDAFGVEFHFSSASAAGRHFGGSVTTVAGCCNGESKTSFGLSWRWVDGGGRWPHKKRIKETPAWKLSIASEGG